VESASTIVNSEHIVLYTTSVLSAQQLNCDPDSLTHTSNPYTVKCSRCGKPDHDEV